MKFERLLDIASFVPKAANFPNSWVGHLPFAAWIIQEISPTVFVELGTHTGNSYFGFCQSVVEAGLATRCCAIDTWQGDAHAGEYSDEVFAKVDAYNSTHYGDFSQLLRMTFDQAVDSFADASIQLLHIDGLHTYEAVRHDFETWLPKLAPGAVVLFHDTNIFERGFGVWRLWDELQARYPYTLTFTHSCGLGVLQLDTAGLEDRLEWLSPEFPQRKAFVRFLQSLGSSQLERSDLAQTIAQRDETIAALHEEMSHRDKQIAAILTSTSWRITRPLRQLRSLIG